MRKKTFIIILMGIFLIILSCGQQGRKTPNHLTRMEIREGWKLLFDGKTTEGWRGYLEENVGNGWIVEDGMLACLGKGGDIGGDIITTDQYGNFELTLEWKISAGGNSGVFYHVVEDTQYAAAYMTGPEYQLIDDAGYPGDLEPWQEAGADYAMYVAGENKKLMPAMEWNRTRIVFDNGRVEHWLNGEKIVAFEAWSEEWEERVAKGKWKDFPAYGQARIGHIGLQDHGDRIWFRNIKIKTW